MVACKYLNDFQTYNRDWARAAKHFTLEDVNLMERQFITLMDYHLGFDDEDLQRELFVDFQPAHCNDDTESAETYSSSSVDCNSPPLERYVS
jgi:hypothetical protein